VREPSCSDQRSVWDRRQLGGERCRSGGAPSAGAQAFLLSRLRSDVIDNVVGTRGIAAHAAGHIVEQQAMARPPGNIVPKVGGKDRLRNVSSFAVDLAPSAWVGTRVSDARSSPGAAYDSSNCAPASNVQTVTHRPESCAGIREGASKRRRYGQTILIDGATQPSVCFHPNSNGHGTGCSTRRHGSSSAWLS